MHRAAAQAGSNPLVTAGGDERPVVGTQSVEARGDSSARFFALWVMGLCSVLDLALLGADALDLAADIKPSLGETDAAVLVVGDDDGPALDQEETDAKVGTGQEARRGHRLGGGLVAVHAGGAGLPRRACLAAEAGLEVGACPGEGIACGSGRLGAEGAGAAAAGVEADAMVMSRHLAVLEDEAA